MAVLIDHISKEMNELNLIRCQKIPKRPGADWRDLPEEKVATDSFFKFLVAMIKNIPCLIVGPTNFQLFIVLSSNAG